MDDYNFLTFGSSVVHVLGGEFNFKQQDTKDFIECKGCGSNQFKNDICIYCGSSKYFKKISML